MPWVRLDEQTPDHPKIVTVGPLAAWLHVSALAYCNRFLTDGFVPRAQVARLVNFDGIYLGGPYDDGSLAGELRAVNNAQLAHALVETDIWDEVPGGYQIHDFHEYQPSREQVLAERQRKVEAGQKGGVAKATNRSRAVAKPKQSASRTSSTSLAEPVAEHLAEVVAKTYPDPVPDPVPVTTKDLLIENHTPEVRLVELCSAHPDAIRGEAAGVINHLRRYVSEQIIDESLGVCATLAKPPDKPRYLVHVARTQTGGKVEIPDYRVSA